MTNVLQNALLVRLRSADWYHGYSDDYSVYAEGKRTLDSIRFDLQKMPIAENQEILAELLKDQVNNELPIGFLRMIIANQIKQ